MVVCESVPTQVSGYAYTSVSPEPVEDCDVAREDHARQVLDVDLVHNPRARRYHLEIVERGLTPPQELIALSVALIFDLHVPHERVGGAEHVGDD